MAGPIGSLNEPTNPDADLSTRSVHVGDPDSRGKTRSPWFWIPTVNFAQGLQFIAVTQLFITVFFTMGMDKGSTALWVGALAFPWTIKPLWGPLVDKYWTKRNWTIWMQLLVGICFLVSAFSLHLGGAVSIGGESYPIYFIASIVALFVLAIGGATHDIACDGYYMLALREKQQAFFVGIRSTMFRLGWLTATGLLLMVADYVQSITGPAPQKAEVRVSVAGAPVQAEEFKAASIEGRDGPQLIINPAVLQVNAGETGVMNISLSKAPATGETITAVMRNPSENIAIGDKSRITFDSTNWNQPVPITFTPSAKLTKSDLAHLKFTAGNVPLSWMVAMVLCGSFFVFCFFWHQFAMPVPAADLPPAGKRPPFIIPLIAVVVGVVVPFFIYQWLYGSMDTWFGEGLRKSLSRSVPQLTTDKGWRFVFGMGRLIALVAFTAILIYLPFTKKVLAALFNGLSNWSGIGFADVFSTFFAKKGIWVVLGFIMTFRLGEALLSTMKNFFLIDPKEAGGLGMSLSASGFANSVTYVAGLIFGGILGGGVIAKYGLKKVFWPMVFAMHLPNLTFVYLSYEQPDNLLIINICVGLEAFFYAFGLTCFLLVMIMAAQGPYKTAHYALCTGFMALGAMVPSMASGFLQEWIGYKNFFWFVMIACIPGTLFIPFLPIDPMFGKKASG